MIIRIATTLVALLASATGANAQQVSATKPRPRIEDNSFLIEEAYNQGRGVVQHINTFQRARDGSWLYSFTQEWPAPSQRHQLSYTVPMQGGGGESSGIGDIALNYRYQAIGADEERTWFAPRLSVYVPSGRVSKGTGAGAPTIEINLPLSHRLGESLVAHLNAGASIVRADNGAGVRRTARGVRGGVSAIWLVAPTFNVMLESIATRADQVSANGTLVTSTSYIVSPGIRGAINFESGLQIVPGIAVPLGVGSSNGQRDVFMYLSFEHAFRR